MASGKSAVNRRGIVVVTLIVLAVALSLVAVLWYGAEGSAAKAVVHKGDGSVEEFSLERDGTFPVSTEAGVNVIQIADGAVRVSEADCPNGDCVDQGFIDRPGQQIVCLPHELWVEVVPADDAQEVADDGQEPVGQVADGGSGATDAAGGDSAAGTAEGDDAPHDGFDTVGS